MQLGNETEGQELGLQMPVLSLVPTERFLPHRSISLIDSLGYLHHGDELEGMLYQL